MSITSALDWLCTLDMPIRPIGAVEGPYLALCRMGLAKTVFRNGGFYFVPTDRGRAKWELGK